MVQSSVGGGRLSRGVVIALATVLLPIMVAASFDFGVTWDEEYRHQNGRDVLDFLLGERTRESFNRERGNLYPGFFDTVCAALERWIPLERYTLRHVVTAVFGWIGIVYSARLAGRLFGPWTGVLAMILLAASPRYFAHSMNNPKDLPFAAMTVVALYYMSTISSKWPYVSWSVGIKITVALALALGIRPGGLLYLGYFGLFVLTLLVREGVRDWRRLADTAGRLLAVTVGVLVLGTVFWPWAGGGPFTRPVIALFGVSDFPWEGSVLYDGALYAATELPWHYVPWWLLISTPLVVLAGAALSVLVASRDRLLRTAALWSVALFPIAATMLRDSTLYDGVRHLLFVYPVLVVLAAAGWTGVHSRARGTPLRVAIVALLVAGLAAPIVFLIRFHPNQIVYFNEIVGGPRGAALKYDMDYWGNCMLQAVDWTAELARVSSRRIAITGTPAHVVQHDARRFPEVAYVDESLDRHHVEITLARGSRAAIRQLVARPALHHVTTRDGAVLCVITAGPAYGELRRGFPQPRQQTSRARVQ